MLDQSGDIIHGYPGGIITVAENKKIPATFSRPWQSRIPVPNPKECAYHKPEERSQALLTETDPEGEQWFVIDSLFAREKPHHLPHRLILPDNCWDDERMRHLGGLSKIKTAIGLATKQFSREDEEDRKKLWGFFIQIGPLAGQNVPHCHYHLYRPNLYLVGSSTVERFDDPGPTIIKKDDIMKNKDVVVLCEGSSGFSVIAGGQLTGQLFCFPSKEMSFDQTTAPDISSLISDLVLLYAYKFRSVQRLAPDYRWEFEIYDGKIHFGIFVPRLNNIGRLEDMAIIDRRRGMSLLWSHEETARYLRGG